MPEPTPTTTHPTLRVAVAQSTVRRDPSDVEALRESGAEVRGFMRQAAKAGARLVHFTEGALCFPDKRVMSELGPEYIGPSDWSKAQWHVPDEEFAALAALAAELGIWTAIASIHQLPAQRPYNSLYVISDQGEVVARYDERTLSTTKITYMYTPGTTPVTFELDGYRFGLAVGMDAHIPEIFIDYVRQDVDAVLLSYASSGLTEDAVALVAPANAAINRYWLSLAVSTNPALPTTGAGILDTFGQWAAQCPRGGGPALTTYDLHKDDALNAAAQTWRQEARTRVTS